MIRQARHVVALWMRITCFRGLAMPWAIYLRRDSNVEFHGAIPDRMKAIIAAMLCAVSFGVQARDWTDSEKAWAAAFLATSVVDWGQTRYIARHPDRFRELNPLLPDHPTLGDVNRHFLVSTAVMLAAAHYLPKYRTAMLQVWVAVGVIGTARNAHIGVRFDF